MEWRKIRRCVGALYHIIGFTTSIIQMSIHPRIVFESRHFGNRSIASYLDDDDSVRGYLEAKHPHQQTGGVAIRFPSISDVLIWSLPRESLALIHHHVWGLGCYRNIGISRTLRWWWLRGHEIRVHV